MRLPLCIVWILANAIALRADDASSTYPRLLHATAWVRTTTQGVGTGWVVDAKRRWLVTNLHVVGDQDRVEAFFVVEKEGRPIAERSYYLENQKALHDDGHAVWGKVIARREASDLALVELEKLPDGVTAVPLAASRPGPGDKVLSVGHRQDAEALWLACAGEVRQVGALTDGYFWRGKKLAVNVPCLITQSPILPGDSGGALVNDKGEVVGVLSGLRQAPQAAIAIQVSEVRDLLAQAKKEETVKEKSDKPNGTETYRKLVAATGWVRPTATEGRGAGFVIDKERRLLLTTNSAAGSFDLVDVLFPLFEKSELIAESAAYADRIGLRKDGLLVRGIVLFRDPKRDLALIELNPLPKHVGELLLAKDEPRPTDRVHALSHPSGVELLWLHSSGTVRQAASIELVSTTMGEPVKPRTLLLQIPHQSSSSGGPVVNEVGEVVGLLAAKEGAQQQLGYAIAASELKAFLEAARPLYAPKTAEDYHRRGKLFFSRGKSAEGFELMEKANKLDARSSAILIDLIGAAQSKFNFKYSMEVAERLVALDPESFEYLSYRADALTFVDKKMALNLCNEILDKDQKNGRAYFARSVCKTGAEMLTDLDNAILYAPTLVDAYKIRAMFFNRMGEDDKALADWSRAIELDPYDLASLDSRADLHLKKRDFKRAIADFERKIDIAADQVCHLRIAEAWMQLGEEANAVSSLVAALRLDLLERTAFDAIATHGDLLRKNWPDDPARRCKWYEQALKGILNWLEDPTIYKNVLGILQSRDKDWNDQRWAEELDKRVRALGGK